MSRAAIFLRPSRVAGLICVTLLACSGCPKPAAERQPVRKEGGFQPGPGKILEPTTGSAPVPTSETTSVKPAFGDCPKPAATIVATGQLMGYIEPCGCSGLEN